MKITPVQTVSKDSVKRFNVQLPADLYIKLMLECSKRGGISPIHLGGEIIASFLSGHLVEKQTTN